MIDIDNVTNNRVYSNHVIVNLACTNDMESISPLSPYYPHGGIPIPYSHRTCKSVFDVWNTLRVSGEGSDRRFIRFRNSVGGNNEYWNLTGARLNILIPVYCWMLENKVFELIECLRIKSKKSTVMILDKSVNSDIYNTERPLAISYLLKSYLEGTGPYIGAIQEKITNDNITVGRRDYDIERKIVVSNKIAIFDTEPILPLD